MSSPLWACRFKALGPKEGRRRAQATPAATGGISQKRLACAATDRVMGTHLLHRRCRFATCWTCVYGCLHESSMVPSWRYANAFNQSKPVAKGESITPSLVGSFLLSSIVGPLTSKQITHFQGITWTKPQQILGWATMSWPKADRPSQTGGFPVKGVRKKCFSKGASVQSHLAVAQNPVPKWLALVSGNMDQNLRFAPPG